MLLNFTVGNWMSYRDEVSLNMVASLERQHGETLAKIPRFRSKKALPIGAVYGGNASGKTGIFKGIAALKHMVTVDPGVDGVLPVSPFMLEGGTESKPTVFDITFLAADTVYRYVVEATIDGISYESLEVLTERGGADVFERDESGDVGVYAFGEALGSADYLSFVGRSTRKNQTFLGNAYAQNVAELADAYEWISETLELVGVESQAWSFATAAVGREGFLEYAAAALSRLDTGIVGLVGEGVEPDVLPKDAKLRRSMAELDGDELITVVMEKGAGDYGFEMLTVHSDEGAPRVERLRTVHVGPDGRERRFSLGMESSGTQRLMGLLPMLFDLQNTDGSAQAKVYVVDELDRCLHTMLTKRLIEDFLSTCGANTRKQLLFTTHDLLLMDQFLMRRDEMYIAQRGTDGCSVLVGLAEFSGIRFDKDLIRSYLDGRFGGIPMLGKAGARG
ncbi:ATP/GTP-binding protein [Adlercreutzia sp. ZJ138]|uniref:AAA family ATPase n=1 Tax=Adlercreutzia sp. ZJ138 TaxID=2709405 RepID=UPI0013EDABE3|nr:ATP-binding protein [Adlercreutzia sp. ZJ138]